MKHLLKEIDEAIEDIAFFKSVPQWQQRAEARLAKKLKALYAEAEDAVLEQLRVRGIPSDISARRRMLIRMQEIESEMGEKIAEEVEDSAEHGKNKAVDDLRKAGRTIKKVPPLSQKLIRDMRNSAFDASKKTLKRHIGDVMGKLATAYEKGLGIDDAVELIRDQFTTMKNYELERIARTEINTAQHKVAHETIRNLGGQYEMWVSALDSRVRDSHEYMHGEIVRVGDTFSNGLQHPGDRAGPPEEVINCFTDPQVPIYTIDGWKRICDIQAGELVLTHKGRFRKVTKILSGKQYSGDVVTINTRHGKIITVTPSHRILTTKGWKEAQEITTYDKAVYLFYYGIEYKQAASQVVSVGRKELAKSKRLYNFAVEEDESYIANDFTVHNCRCRVVPFIIPPDKMPPLGVTRFREGDLIDRI